MALRKSLNHIFSIFAVIVILFNGSGLASAQSLQPAAAAQPAMPKAGPMVNDEIGTANTSMPQMRGTTQAMRQAAASHKPATATGSNPGIAGTGGTNAGQILDYFGVANYANSPLPAVDSAGAVTGGIRKFVDGLPGLCGVSAPNDLGQCIPLAVADTTTFAGTGGNPAADYYEIALVEYTEQLHSDLPATRLRGYVQVETSAIPSGKSAHVALFYPDGVTQIKDAGGNLVYGVAKPSYLGPTILATRNRPVRVKFTNYLPTTDKGGNLFIPTDTTYMGAGMGPGGSIKRIDLTNAGGAGYTASPTVVFSAPPQGGTLPVATANVISGMVVSFDITNGGSGYTSAPTVTLTGGGYTTRATAATVLDGLPGEMYTQNRATLHLHGGNTPWISDGTPHQWTTPQGEATSYSKGDSVAYVPDMWFVNGSLVASCAQQTTCAVAGATNDPGPGSLSFYWTNQQSGRLMFYHDHAYGTTRLNVYAGEAAGYLLTDPAQEDLLAAAGVPGTVGSTPATTDLAHVYPLVIQDKTFVPDTAQLLSEDPTWVNNTTWGQTKGSLWFPHVYTPNQNPNDPMTGANAFGRWDYGPWFWPPQNGSTFVSPPAPCATNPAWTCPGIPNPSGTPEGFMDTPVINGTAYPTLTVDPTKYRFQMLMAGNDRTFNLGWYQADPLAVAITNGGSGYTSAPTVTFTGGGGSGAAATAVISVGTILQSGIGWTNVGAGYTTVPNVTIGGDGAGATATALLDGNGHLGSITVTNGGNGYTTAYLTIDPPACVINGTTCVQATATATVTPSGIVIALLVTSPGTGYTSNPTISISGGGGTGATAIASVNTEVKMVDAAPHSAASALKPCSAANPTGTSGAMLVTALFDASGNPLNGTGLPANCYPSAWPTDGRDGGVPDPTTAGPPFIQIGTEGGLLPHAVVIPSTPNGYEYNRRSITVLNIFTHGLLLGPAERADVVVDFSGFAGKTLILYNDAPAPVPAFDPRVDYYTGDPDQTSTGGAPTTLPGYGPNTRTLMQVKVKGTTPTAAINMTALQAKMPVAFAATQEKPIIPEPDFPAGFGQGGPNYVKIQDNYVQGWLTTGNPIGGLTITNGGTGYQINPTVTITGGGGNGAKATAAITGGVGSISVVNVGSRYNTAPTVTISAPPAGGTQALATATLTASRTVASIKVTAAGSGYTTAPTVTLSAPGGGGTTATARAILNGVVTSLTLTNPGTGFTSTPTITINKAPGDTTGTGAAAKAESMHMEPKAIQELFTLDYGRMNATLGSELSFTNFFVQTTIPYGYVDPPTELFKDGDTEIWKITHNGVDTHFIHFHLFTVQVLNRVGWDGAVKPPDPNEVAWKDTVRMNPLEDIIVALHPMKQNLPWAIPNSIHKLDVTRPIGAAEPNEFANVDPANQPAPVINALINFGYEYVVHCHILGHEENDMMRAMLMAVKPEAPSNLTTTALPRAGGVRLTWKDNALTETGFTVQHSVDKIGWVTDTSNLPASPKTGGTVTYTDTNLQRRTPYFFRVMANNVIGYTQTYAAPSIGYPTMSYDSNPVSTAGSVRTNSLVSLNYLDIPELVFANSFADGLVRFASTTGDVQAAQQAAMGGAEQGMAATVDGGNPAYVVDTSPSNETEYHANFLFNPNWTATGTTPLTIFSAQDPNSATIVSIQYMRNDEETEDHTFLVRASALMGGKQVFTEWYPITNAPHQLEISWTSSTSALVNFYVDNSIAGTLSGDTSASKISKETLGASEGLTSAASGTLFFGEFTSVRLNDIHFATFLPVIGH